MAHAFRVAFCPASLCALWKSLPEGTGQGMQIGTRKDASATFLPSFVVRPFSKKEPVPDSKFSCTRPGRCALISQFLPVWDSLD
jgi:hypothetical protein